jgi:hypothetical protein
VVDISKLKSAVIEKQELILNRLTTLTYEEVMHLMASLSAIISNLDKFQAEEEIHCNRLLVSTMDKDAKITFSKAEAVLKCSDIYLSYKNFMSLKQCASRGLNLARLHVQYLLNPGPPKEVSGAEKDEGGSM